VRYLVKTPTILLPDSVAVERLKVPERGEVEQHHDKQHLGQGQFAFSAPFLLRRKQPVSLPLLENLAEVIQTAVQCRDVYRQGRDLLNLV
jgi:hypothetical protein